MKVLIALAFLAVAAARPDASPVALPPAALPEVEEIESARPNVLVAEIPATMIKVVNAPFETLDAPVTPVKFVDAPLEAPVSFEAVKVVDAPLEASVSVEAVKVVDAPLEAPVSVEAVKVVDAPLEAPVSVEAVKFVDAPLEDVVAPKYEAVNVVEASLDAVRVVEQPLDAPALQMIAPSELESIRVADVPAEAFVPTVDAVKVVEAPLDVAPVLQEAVSSVRVVDAPEIFQALHPMKDYGNPLLRGQR